tara:strand:+ start:870 stop:1580 length:711 start_codon:yes stop_codon:yes gene_type:complete
MNNEDKILLMSYVDGELDNSEALQAEALIESNKVARGFVNQLKTANNSMQASYQSNEFKELDKRLETFVNENFIKERASIADLMSNFFLSRQTLNYSLTALFFLSVGIFYDDYMFEMDFEEESQIEVLSQPSSEKVTLLTLSSELHEKQVLKTRGLETENNSLKSYIKETIQEMLEVNTSEGVLKYGSENVAIFLEEKTIQKDLLTCYSGSIFTNGFKSNILFCTSPNDTSLIYTN